MKETSNQEEMCEFYTPLDFWLIVIPHSLGDKSVCM